MNYEDLKKATELLDGIERHVFSEIKIMQSPLIKDGNPILMISENDYKLFSEKYIKCKQCGNYTPMENSNLCQACILAELP